MYLADRVWPLLRALPWLSLAREMHPEQGHGSQPCMRRSPPADCRQWSGATTTLPAWLRRYDNPVAKLKKILPGGGGKNAEGGGGLNKPWLLW